mgnify:FL=1
MRPTFPKYLQEIRDLMPKLLDILEKDRKENWYSFIWLEESKEMQYVSAITEVASENLDRGVVMRVFVNGQNFEKSTNQLDQKSLFSLANDFRKELDLKFPKLDANAYAPSSWGNEKSIGLSSELLSQIDSSLNRSSQIHFAPNCEINPFESSVAKLKDIASKTRKELFNTTKKNIKNNPIFSELADIKVMVRQSLTTHVFVDREKNMSQIIPVIMNYSMGMTKLGQSARAITGGLGGLELTKLSKENINEVTFRSLQLANAKKLSPGRYKVISGPDVTGVIPH